MASGILQEWRQNNEEYADLIEFTSGGEINLWMAASRKKRPE